MDNLYEITKEKVREKTGQELSEFDYFRVVKQFVYNGELSPRLAKEMKEYWFTKDEKQLSDACREYIKRCLDAFCLRAADSALAKKYFEEDDE